MLASDIKGVYIFLKPQGRGWLLFSTHIVRVRKRKVAMLSKIVKRILLGLNTRSRIAPQKTASAWENDQDYSRNVGPGDYAIYKNSTLVAISSATSYISLDENNR